MQLLGQLTTLADESPEERYRRIAESAADADVDVETLLDFELRVESVIVEVADAHADDLDDLGGDGAGPPGLGPLLASIDPPTVARVLARTVSSRPELTLSVIRSLDAAAGDVGLTAELDDVPVVVDADDVTALEDD
jgi:hypothetical protein